MSREAQTKDIDISYGGEPLGKRVSGPSHIRPGKCAALIDIHIADLGLIQSGAEVHKGYSRSGCPSPEARGPIDYPFENTESTTTGSSHSSRSQEESKSAFSASRVSYRQPECKTDSQDSQSASGAQTAAGISLPELSALNIRHCEPETATTKQERATTKRKRVEVGSDELDEEEVNWRKEQSRGVLPSQWFVRKRR